MNRVLVFVSVACTCVLYLASCSGSKIVVYKSWTTTLTERVGNLRADFDRIRLYEPERQSAAGSLDLHDGLGTGGGSSNRVVPSPSPQGTSGSNSAPRLVSADIPGWSLEATMAAQAAQNEDYPVHTPGRYPSVLDNHMIVAFYGNPHSSRMGILGEQSIEETALLLKEQAHEYDRLNGDQGVIPAFHLIYGTVWADANIGFLSDRKIKEYVDYASAHDMIVILDHQLGKYNVEESITRMLPWLKYANVHLAIDPEWKTLNPGTEIGGIQAEDVNKAQDLIQNYLVAEGLETKKILIIHQFNWRMIIGREKVKTDFDRVDLIHNADGFGPPSLKLETYNFVAAARNIPVKGFKIFYPKSWKSEGYDAPLMTPEQVLSIRPRPVYINYQ